MKRYIIVVLIAFSIISCTSDPPKGPTNIRIKNASDYNFKDVYVNTTGGENDYGDINKGGITGYKTFDFAYGIAGVKLIIDTSKYALWLPDLVGETYLGTGNFTYIVTVTDTVYKQLQLKHKKD